MLTQQSALTVALVGNPNTGKSTLFSALVGMHQHVGNYPGVTVEKKTGRMEVEGQSFEIIDLPGVYSLAPRSRDEMAAVNVLLGRQADVGAVDAVVCLVDASNLRRNLYLLSQVLELGLPTAVALNMVDVAARRGIVVDAAALQARLGVPVVATEANHGIGLDALKTALVEAVGRGPRAAASPLPEAFHREVTQLESESRVARTDDAPLPHSLWRRVLLDANGYLQRSLWPKGNRWLGERLAQARRRLAAADCDVPGVETRARYAWASKTLEGIVTEPACRETTGSDRIDRVLTHRLWGTLIFALLMLFVFQSVFAWAQPLTRGINLAAAAVGHWIEASMAAGALRSLLVDGVVAGVGSVLAFLPQILILFFFIAVLEDCGYMARAAFLMDRLMVRVGLSGRSFIPMLSSFACAVPGIMATRRDRKRPRPLDDDPRRAAADLLGAAAGLCPVDRRVHPVAGLSRRSGRSPGADVGRAVRPRDRRRDRRRALAETDALARPDAAVPHGIAQLQVAFAGKRLFPHGPAGVGLPPLRRHADLGHLRDPLGGALLSP